MAVAFRAAARSTPDEPRIARSVNLRFVGDWGQANFHRVLSVLSQEFFDRAGQRTRTSIWSIRDGGNEGLTEVQDGLTDLTLATPVAVVAKALESHEPGTPLARLYSRSLPNLRALAILPQNDSIILAVHPRFCISTFEELRRKKPALRIATCVDDGTSFIGYVAMLYLKAHGMSDLESWGGSYKLDCRPDQSLYAAQSGEVDAVLQEAIMTPWWSELIEKHGWVPLPIEKEALEVLKQHTGLKESHLAAGFWSPLLEDLPTLSFEDFVVVVRDDMPDDVAYLLTWCLVEQRDLLESGYHHIPPEKSPLSYPLIPAKMGRSPLPLHPAARRFYEAKGYLE